MSESEGCGYGGVQCVCVGREWEVLYMGEGVCVEKVPPLLQQVHED